MVSEGKHITRKVHKCLTQSTELKSVFFKQAHVSACCLQQLKKDMESQRDMLADALYKKGLALSEMEEQTPVSDE